MKLVTISMRILNEQTVYEEFFFPFKTPIIDFRIQKFHLEPKFSVHN